MFTVMEMMASRTDKKDNGNNSYDLGDFTK